MEGVAAEDKENSLAEARQQLLARLQSSGVFNSVKAHLRAQLFTELKGRELASALQPPCSPTLRQHVLNCLVAEYLLTERFKYSLSVFLAESGNHRLPSLPRDELLRLAGVAPGSRLHTLLLAAPSGSDSGGDSGGGSGGGGGCLAASMVDALACLDAEAVPTVSAACQTEEAPAASAALLARLQQIEAEYRQRSTALEARSAASAEEQVAACQRQCEERYAAQLAAQVARVRESEIAAVREQEAAKYLQQLAGERETLQRAHRERLERLRSQEEELLGKVRKAQQVMEQQGEEYMQRMRGEEERLRGWRCQEEAALVAKAAEAARRLEQVEKELRLAAERQRVAEEALQARSAALQVEVQRQEEDLCRQQAALDMEREQLQRTRAEVAAQAAEAALARQQVASVGEAHARERSDLLQELDTLRSRLGAAQQEVARLEVVWQHRDRGAEHGTSSPQKAAAPRPQQAEQQQALRALRQEQALMQQELAVSRARERLWRETASTNERLLEKAGKWHEQCLQHVEELRLCLGAAVREVADLQQQAQLVATSEGTQGPLGAALAAAISDAQRWREATAARLVDASQQEARLRKELSRLHRRAAANHLSAVEALQGLLALYVQGRQQQLPTGQAPLAAELEQAVAAAGGAGPEGQEAPDAGAAAAAAMGAHRAVEAGAEMGAGWGSGSMQAQPWLQVQVQPQPQPQAQHWAAEAPSSSLPCRSRLSESSSSPSEGSSSAESTPRHRGSNPSVAGRTTSDILAAYRSRQRAASVTGGSGGGSGGVAAAAEPPASAPDNPRRTSQAGAEKGEEGGAAAGSSATEGRLKGLSLDGTRPSLDDGTSVPGQSSVGPLPAREQQPATAVADAGEDYYFSEFSSEDSKF